jgi:hypothetical protein
MIVDYKINKKRFLRRLEKQLGKLDNNYILITDYPEYYKDTSIQNIISVKKTTDKFLDNNLETIFIYAVENNSIGLPIVKKLIEKNITFYAAPASDVGGYVYDNKVVRDIIESESEIQEREGFSKFGDPGSLQDYVNLCQAIEATMFVEGDIVEIGVFRGSSSCIILKYLESFDNQKPIWFFDTFEGFTYEEAHKSVDRIWANTHQTEGYDIISKRILSRAINNKNVEIKKLNIISDKLPSQIKKISVCNIDVDMLEAVEAAFEQVAPLMSVGGIMICEDAGHTPALIGARLALDNFLKSEQGKFFIPVHMTSGQVFLIRVAL